MPGMKKKATPSPKPTITGLKKSNLDKVASKVKGFKNVNLDKPKAGPAVKGIKQVNLDKPKPKPTPSPSTFAQKSAAAEAMLRKLMKEGKVKDLNKTRDMIAKKYGVRPNGRTN